VPSGEGVPEEELPECLDHHSSSFLKGKPRCMLTQPLYIYLWVVLLVYYIKW
jgi:hypothetical protein